MNRISTVTELFSYDDWAMSQLFNLALALPDEQLDRKFEMGLGSLRATLIHTYGAKELWYQRVQLGRAAKWTKVADQFPISALRTRWHDDGGHWSSLKESELDRSIDYNDMQGNPHTSRLLDIALHVVNHGTYHRAQASNMLRHLGATPPRIDYIFRKVETPTNLSLDVVRYCYKCSDRMRDRVFVACENLSDEQLDRTFEMGLGTLRATLDHMSLAEQWWIGSWIGKPQIGFPRPESLLPVAQIRAEHEKAARKRDEILSQMKSDGELSRMIEARPTAEITKTFSVGVTMLQLCLHGTHHRAQVVNMLRHLGANPPRTDLILMTRKS